MRLMPVIRALRERCQLLEGRVGGAIEWSTLDRLEIQKYPAAYVVPKGAIPSGNESATGYLQTVTNNFAVIVMVAKTDARGQGAYEQLDELEASVFKSILGWQMEPKDEHTEIVFERADLIYADRDRVAYQLEFSFETVLDTSDTYQGVELTELSSYDGFDARVQTQENGALEGEPIYKLKVDINGN